MNLFEAYGIKEVADVVFYDTATGAPVIYFDTLKVSTIEQTGEQSTANGGKGNAPLIVWDYGKNITLTLEDALFSMKSMAIMFGGRISKTKNVTKARKFTAIDGTTKPAWAPADAVYTDQLGKVVEEFEKGQEYIVTWMQMADTEVITINAESFPGTYKVVGDTYARDRQTGKDEFFQFVIPMAKLNSENTLTMQAEGDPSTFSMTLQVLRPEDGDMMKLIKYPNTEGKVYTDENLIIDMGDGLNFVPKKLESIEITTEPTKKTYTSGEAIDLTGIRVTATYDDETTKENITEKELTASPTQATSSGPVTVSYAEAGVIKSDTYEITVS